MAITKPKPKTTADVFISGAPDAAAQIKLKTPGVNPRATRHVQKGKKVQITLTITPGLLERVDELAVKIGQSRAAVINMAVYRMVEHGVTIEGL
jgi:hypothetical protein